MLLHSIAFYSQNTVLSGHVIDEEKQDVAGATIQCFLQDTLFLGGSVSNSNGLFSISVPTFSTDYKLIVKYLGYTDNVLFLKGKTEKSSNSDGSAHSYILQKNLHYFLTKSLNLY